MITRARNTTTTATLTQPACTCDAVIRVTMPAITPASSTMTSPLA